MDFLALIDAWLLGMPASPERLRLTQCRREIEALREQIARLQLQIFRPEEE